MPLESGPDRGVLRLSIDGGWSVEAMANALTVLGRAYDHLATALAIEDWRAEPLVPREWLVAFHGGDYLLALRARARIDSGPLQLRRLEYASPGLIEAVGAWSPLSALVDLVANHRRENTERAQIREQSRQFDATADRQRIQDSREFLLALLDRLGPLPPEFATAILGRLLGEIPDLVASLADDARIGTLELDSADAAP